MLQSDKEGTAIAPLYGHITGLKKSAVAALERIYRRRVPPKSLITPELARTLTEITQEINRQIGVIIDRGGFVTHVIVGDAKSVFIPDLDRYPIGRKALRGLRFIHTHLRDERLSNEDLADLSLLRFDMVASLWAKDGLPHTIDAAHLMPLGSEKKIETVTSPFHVYSLDFADFIRNLEAEMDRSRVIAREGSGERAILVSAATSARYDIEDSMEELKELALSSDVVVLDTVIQRLKEMNPRFLLGEGKLREIVIQAMDKGATLLIFDQDLTPSQIRAITEMTELKVIDRTQLILDIFARRAHTRDGKVQVELAQLKYMLPRLTGKGTALSRLMGGIGGRGPGEMKLEIDRRRIRDRITGLERELRTLGEARKQRKHRRVSRDIPIVSIIGYTNAGKSTLLNGLTRSATFVEDKMFATLDTASRRLRFPREREVIITDTVGFIRDLPKDLMAAFRTTLEELEDASLLLHLVDAANPRFEQQMESVEGILRDLGLNRKERLLVFNKKDRIPPGRSEILSTRFGAIAVSANDPRTFPPLLAAMEHALWGAADNALACAARDSAATGDKHDTHRADASASPALPG